MFTAPQLHPTSIIRRGMLAACAASLFGCGGQAAAPTAATPATAFKPLLVVDTAADDGPFYTMTILTASSGWPYGQGLNNRGLVVGAVDALHTPFFSYAAVWDGHKATGWEAISTIPTFATAINDAGQIAGYTVGMYSRQAMLWRGGTATALPAVGGDYGGAISINASGDAVGESSTAGNQASHATLWTNGSAIDLGTLGGGLSSIAWDINDRGDIVGNSTISDDYSISRAVLWKNHVAYDLGTFGGADSSSSSAAAINNRGQIVGLSRTVDGKWSAVLWENGTIRDLGTLAGGTGANANDINNAGQIVGQSDNANLQGRATLWQGDRIIDLNTRVAPIPGITLNTAIRINDSGQILAQLDNGDERIALLTPISRTSASK